MNNGNKIKKIFLPVCALICILLIFPWQVGACGWAGDAESDEDDETIWIGADGKPIAENNLLDNPEFQTEIGNRYRIGHGSLRNYEEAIRWYKMAASAGFAPAQNNLGNMFEQGLGVSKDNALAARWYLTAAEQGNEKAQHSLGQMYEEGRGVSRDLQKAAEWILRSAEAGHHSAMGEIATMLWEGRGIPKDRVQAYKWWKLSAMHGDDTSDQSLEMAKLKMKPEKIDEAEKDFAAAFIPPKKRTVLGLYLTAKAAFTKWKKNSNKFKILDTRTVGEYIFVGHAPMAFNIPVQFLSTKVSSPRAGPVMNLNKNFVSEVKEKFKETETILVMCRSGVRSAMAVNMLAQSGFKRVYSILNGFEGDKLKARKNPNNGKRVINGWRNSNVPWTYDLYPKLMYHP